ncbi:hypothetical protein LPJ66_004193 [Kickxella alabastrina]|uniref:Uncharacterized protein n=1 Tax=Kickxella alabastrina TaxID=61397 RepID=A0ACC1IHZ6_9FUNG|nr:hypothetical protein LPJ66_004193 [Kickxella alabastrina]
MSSFGPKRARRTTARTPLALSDSTNRPTAAYTGSLDKFRPWSREDLLARISTYKIHTWLVQSQRLSPVRCARSGWVNIDCSTLKCTACSAILIAEVPEDLTDSEETQWLERLGQQLQSSHNASCPWKGHECAASVYNMPLATSRETVDEVCQQAADMLVFSAQLPSTKHPLSAFQTNLTRDLKSTALGLFENTSPNAESVPEGNQIISSLILALFGWRVDLAMPRPAIKCELCFRSAGLWLFDSNSSSRSGDQGISGASNTGESDLRVFDVVSEHRSFCYWAHGPSLDFEEADDASESCTASPTHQTTAESTVAPQHPATDAIPGWQKIVASLLRAKAMGFVGGDGNGKDKGKGKYGGASGSGSSDEDTSSDSNDSSNSVDGGNSREAVLSDHSDILKQLKPFNISAISSAAKAFGIPFSTGLLARAAKRLAAAHQLEGTQATIATDPALGTAGAVDDGSSSILLAEHIGDHSGWDTDGSAGLAHMGMDATDLEEDAGAHADEYDFGSAAYSTDIEDIPAPIDTSGLEALLGDSSLAAALEDPSRASAILEYIKGLIRANNEATT